MTIVFFILGLILLVAGADILVRGASKISTIFGISPLVVGLTVVAYGTSAPELAVSLKASLAGSADIAVGNVVGSNIFNVLFILGLSASISPLIVSQQLIKLDVPVMIFVSFLAYILALNGFISNIEGFILILAAIVYSLFLIIKSKKEENNKSLDVSLIVTTTSKTKAVITNLIFVLIGLGMLILGSNWLVESAVVFAQLMGLSELIIGLTIISVGTSLPELATSIIASIKGERDIAVGNIVGSNIFNILFILGGAALLSPDGISVKTGVINSDLPLMIAVAIACLPIFFTGRSIEKWEGVVFLIYYAAYIAFLFLTASAHSALPFFNNIMLFMVIPITVLTILITVRNSLQLHRK